MGDVDTPAWLDRVAAQGASVASAAALADAAGVEIVVKTHDEAWVAECVSLEHQIFPRHEAMDIPHELRNTRAVTLLCASPRADHDASLGSCVGYALLQRYDGASDGAAGGSNPFAALRPQSCLLTKLAVAPHLQRRGIGKALLAAAVGHARATRASNCTLHVDEDNARARALYASFGFAPHGERLVDFYRSGRHALELVLDLQAVAAPAKPHRPMQEEVAGEGDELVEELE
jgi:ribosomal protein S18 acetylase RimI-like enzyme